jgi:hypothetical protein
LRLLCFFEERFVNKRLLDLMQEANDQTVGQGVLRMARLAVTAHYFEQSIQQSQAEPLLRLVGGTQDREQEAPTYPIHKYQQDDQASALRKMMEDES